MEVTEIIKIIEADGWFYERQKGSHRQFKHLTKKGMVTVAGKPNDDIAKGTQNNILKQSELR